MKKIIENPKRTINDQLAANTENAETVNAGIVPLIKFFRARLENAQIYRPTWQTGRQKHHTPIAFDPSLTIERVYLEKWQRLFGSEANFKLTTEDPCFGPYQSKFNDRVNKRICPCVTIEVRFYQQKTSKAQSRSKGVEVLKFLYFAANNHATNGAQEDPELIIQDRFDNIYYWRSEGIDTLPQ